MTFEYQGDKVLLQGITSEVLQCPLINRSKLAELAIQDQLWCLIELQQMEAIKEASSRPPEVQQIIDEYSTIFQPPTGLPPMRSSVHTIPLISGAKPFRLKTI